MYLSIILPTHLPHEEWKGFIICLIYFNFYFNNNNFCLQSNMRTCSLYFQLLLCWQYCLYLMVLRSNLFFERQWNQLLFIWFCVHWELKQRENGGLLYARTDWWYVKISQRDQPDRSVRQISQTGYRTNLSESNLRTVDIKMFKKRMLMTFCVPNYLKHCIILNKRFWELNAP